MVNNKIFVFVAILMSIMFYSGFICAMDDSNNDKQLAATEAFNIARDLYDMDPNLELERITAFLEDSCSQDKINKVRKLFLKIKKAKFANNQVSKLVALPRHDTIILPYSPEQARSMALAPYLSNKSDCRKDNHTRLAFNPSFIPHEGFNAIPESLRLLSGVNISYYVSPYTVSQVLGACGTRVIAHALAIRDAIRHDSLSAANVFYEACKYSDLHTDVGYTMLKAIKLAQKNDLHHLHCLLIGNENYEGIFYSTDFIRPESLLGLSNCTKDEVQILIAQWFRSQKTCTAHFYCVVDTAEQVHGHAVLVSLVKKEGEQPKIIYMDCNNSPFDDQSQAAAHIHYLYLLFIANADRS